MSTNPFDNAPAESTAALKLKVVAVGRAGINLAHGLMTGASEPMSFAAISTDARTLAASPIESKVMLETRPLRGMGTGGDPERGRSAAEAATDAIKQACAGADLIFLFTGLGGGTGTGAAPVVARIARETGAMVLAFGTLPFECEGQWRLNQAQQGLDQLRLAADGVICLPNQKAYRLLDENTGAMEVFQRTNDLAAQAVNGLCRLLLRQGLIDVKFADLCSAVRGRQAESAFAFAEASGANRAREAWDKLLAHPLLDEGRQFADASSVLVSVNGGPDLTMAEVNRVMEQVNRLCENARVIMGAAIDPTLGDRLTLTVVVTRRAEEPEETPEAIAEEKAPAKPKPELETEFFATPAPRRPASRFVAPPPESTPEKVEQLLTRQHGSPGRGGRRKSSRMRQEQLPLEIISKGRFDKSEPTIHKGEDLDVPTYIRRGVPLN